MENFKEFEIESLKVVVGGIYLDVGTTCSLGRGDELLFGSRGFGLFGS